MTKFLDVVVYVCLCVDVDECQNGGGHNCSQLCENIRGSFECKCNDGYFLDDDDANCTGMCVCMCKYVYVHRYLRT